MSDRTEEKRKNRSPLKNATQSLRGGDLNQDLIGDWNKFPTVQKVHEWVSS